MRAWLAHATVRALFGVGAATLAIRRPSMTKEPSVCRTPIRPCNDCFIPEPTYKEPGLTPHRSPVRSPSQSAIPEKGVEMTGVVDQEGGRSVRVVVGVDTHQDKHVAVAIDRQGVRLGELHAPATMHGYQDLERWSRSLGEIHAFGIEGTGSYGAGVARYLTRRGHTVVEVNRPDRSTRYRKGKSDPTDAEMAARSVLAGVAEATPKSGEGEVEMIRMIKSVKDSAVKARTQACRCSMIMSVSNCSMKMSVYERTDVDYEGADEDTGVERSDRGQGDGGGGVWADGSERAPCVATTGSIQRGRTCCRGSREQGQEARDHHVPADTREGEGAG